MCHGADIAAAAGILLHSGHGRTATVSSRVTSSSWPDHSMCAADDAVPQMLSHAVCGGSVALRNARPWGRRAVSSTSWRQLVQVALRSW